MISVATRRLPSTLALLAILVACSGTSDDSGTNRSATTGIGAAGAGGADAFGNAPVATAGADGAAAGAGAATAPGDPSVLAPGGPTCASGLANTSPVTPTVWLVLDGSGSMDESFDGQATRWQALRSALMDPGGVVPTLEQGVRFGMVLYAGVDQDQLAQAGLCVNLQVEEPALNNFANLDAKFPQQQLGGWTPTDRALEHVVNTLPIGNQEVLDQSSGPVFVILATDGAPNDHCDPAVQTTMQNRGGSGQDPVVAQRVLDAVGRGTVAGMNLFIISLAGGDQALQSHLEEVAALSRTGTPPFVPATRDDLVTTLQQIVGNATCQIALDGAIMPGAECTGEVLLNGNPVACNADDGFRLLDERTLQLTGSVCDSFLSTESQVHASFPCGVFTPD